MSEQPTLVDREDVSYASVPGAVAMADLGGVVDTGFARLFGCLAARRVTPLGAPLIRYNTIDMARILRIELGVPVPAGTEGDETIPVAVLPGGRYASLLHVGPYDSLVAANAALQAWAHREQIAFDVQSTPEGEAWRSRVEHYITNPVEEPDPTRWQVEIAYLTIDDPSQATTGPT